MRLKLGTLFLIFILSSCGGGGGGGGGTLAPVISNEWNNSISSSEANVYRTSEYNNQEGLELIHAAEAYALLDKNNKTVAGNGVKIGVIDTGAQIDDVEIAGNLYGVNSTSGNYDYRNGDNNPTDDNGHGTHVASTAAGVKDGGGIHGVAFDSTLVVLKALNSSGNGSITNITDSIQGAIDADVGVINMSLGYDNSLGSDSAFKSALVSAKNADILTIAAAGNEGNLQPDYPAYYAIDSSLAGYVLSVVAVDSSLEIATDPDDGFDSNICGDAANYCLAAPGVDIVGAYIGSGYYYSSGTSMASPHVAGAAAVLRAAWPHLTAVQTADILLTTADDLGAVGTDSVYGRGMLNLYEAVQAQGQNTLGFGASVADGGYELTTTSLVTSPIFGDAFSAGISAKLNSAIFFDDYGRDYKADLSSKIGKQVSQNNVTSLNNFVFNNISSRAVPFRFKNDKKASLNFNIATYKNAEAANRLGLKFITLDRSTDPQKGLNHGFSFVQELAGKNTNSQFGFATNVDVLANLEEENFSNFGFISQKNLASNPYQSFMQGSSANLINNRQFNQFFASQNFLAKKMALNFSYQTSYDGASNLSQKGVKQNQILDFTMSLKPKSDSNYLISVGKIDEFDNNILNSKSLGAFESKGDVKTSYAKISASHKLTKNLQFLTSYSEGISKIQGNQYGIFREFNDVRSRSFSASIVLDDFFKGQIGLGYLEPMRVYRGSVKTDVPVARDLAGNLTRLQSQISLAPKGKERDLEVFYLRKISNDAKVKFNFIRQIQAGNIQNSKNNYLGFVQMEMSY